jgi:hypothetical protein
MACIHRRAALRGPRARELYYKRHRDFSKDHMQSPARSGRVLALRNGAWGDPVNRNSSADIRVRAEWLAFTAALRSADPARGNYIYKRHRELP